ncbi:hypothetical protein ccbrp13_18670 [Ktedonobacteria bacterium brp13]|nr:hypothetical protein ccbrp13_18670 [Ktedonobacteria bacterium brp13]
MDYSAVATTTVQDLLGRLPLGLRAWAELHRDAVLAASYHNDGLITKMANA